MLGILGGSGRASKGSICGVAPECSLLPIKVLDKNGNGVQENVIRAIDWILEHKETYSIRIVNISVGTTHREGHERLLEAVEEGLGRRDCGSGSAGNQGPGRGSITAPGCSRKSLLWVPRICW